MTKPLLSIFMLVISFSTLSQVRGYVGLDLVVGSGAESQLFVESEINSKEFTIGNNNFRKGPLLDTSFFSGDVELGLEYLVDVKSTINVGVGFHSFGTFLNTSNDIDSEFSIFDYAAPGQTLGELSDETGIDIFNEQISFSKLYVPVMYTYRFIGSRGLEDLSIGRRSPTAFFLSVGGSYNKHLFTDKLESKPIYDETDFTIHTFSEFAEVKKSGFSGIGRIGLTAFRNDRLDNYWEFYFKIEKELSPRFIDLSTNQKYLYSFYSFGTRYAFQ